MSDASEYRSEINEAIADWAKGAITELHELQDEMAKNLGKRMIFTHWDVDKLWAAQEAAKLARNVQARFEHHDEMDMVDAVREVKADLNDQMLYGHFDPRSTSPSQNAHSYIELNVARQFVRSWVFDLTKLDKLEEDEAR